jgi:hypothetical protein
MSSRKRLKKVNPVSGKSGDAQIDPVETVTTVRSGAMRFRRNKGPGATVRSIAVASLSGKTFDLPLGT